MTNISKNKSTAKIILIALALCLLLTTLAACSAGGLNGTYKSQGLIAQSFTFNSDNSVTMSAFGLNITGTYEIKEDKLTITYSVLGIETSWDSSYEKKGSSIYINDTEFIKQ